MTAKNVLQRRFYWHVPVAQGQTLEVLHTFHGAEGGLPVGDLLLDGSTFYGVTCGGGSKNDGVIYEVDTNGNG